MPIAKLSIDIEAKIATLQQSMDRAAEVSKSSADKIAGQWKTVGSVLSGVAAGLISAFSVHQLVAFFNTTKDGVLAIKDLSEATGASYTEISRLENVARKAGGSLADVSGVLVKFNQALLLESKGNKTVDAVLDAIGISGAKLRELDPVQALIQTASALDRYADSGEKARAIQVLFGKSIREAGPLLHELAENGKINASVTDEQVIATDKFNKQLAEFTVKVQDLGRSILADLIPQLSILLSKLTEAGSKIGLTVANIDSKILSWQLSIAVGKVEALQVALSKDPGNTGLQAGLERARDQAGQLARASFDATQKLKDLAQETAGEKLAASGAAGAGRGFVNPALVQQQFPALNLGAPAKVAKDSARSFEDYNIALTKTFATLAEQTPTVKLALLTDQLAKLDEMASRGFDPKIIEEIRLLLLPPAGAAAGPPLSEEMKKVNELLAQTDSARLAQASRDAALLRDELNRTTAGTQRWLELTDALIDVETKISDLAGVFPKLQLAGDEAMKHLRDTIEGALGSTLSTALRGQFDNIGDLWRNLLIDMAARALATDLMGALFGTKGGGVATPGLIDRFLGWLLTAKGAVFGPGGIVPFASGGIVQRATPFAFGSSQIGVMGEAGPEAIVPLKRGRDGKLGIAGGGGVVINQVINVQSGASRNEVMQAAVAAKNAAVNEIHDLMKRGRMIAA